MKTRKNILLVSAALLVLGYSAWTTTRIMALQTQFRQLEASQSALGRYTYDFGTAITQRNFREMPGPEMAKIILRLMESDDLVRPAVESSRTRPVLVRPSNTSRNPVVETIIQ